MSRLFPGRYINPIITREIDNSGGSPTLQSYFSVQLTVREVFFVTDTWRIQHITSGNDASLLTGRCSVLG